MSAVRAARRRARVAWVAAAVIGALGAACRHTYQRPTAAQPHALVKFRRVYGKTAGTRLQESVQVNGDLAFYINNEASHITSALVDGFRVHPGSARLDVAGRFFFDTLEVNKMSDAVQVPYAASSYPCGTATKPRTCTGSTTGNGANTITSAGSWIVSDSVGACTGRVELVARDQGEYLVELDYRDRKVCTVTCFEVIRSGESIEHRPCDGS